MALERETRTHPGMANGPPSQVALELKGLREEAGLSIPHVAQALGYATASGYQHWEDKFKRKHLPLHLVKKLIPVLGKKGIHPDRLYALAGINDLETPDIDTGPGTEVPMSPDEIELVNLYRNIDPAVRGSLLQVARGLGALTVETTQRPLQRWRA